MKRRPSGHCRSNRDSGATTSRLSGWLGEARDHRVAGLIGEVHEDPQRCGRIGRKRQAEEPPFAPAADDLPEVEQRGLLHDAAPDDADQAILQDYDSGVRHHRVRHERDRRFHAAGDQLEPQRGLGREGARQDASRDENPDQVCASGADRYLLLCSTGSRGGEHDPSRAGASPRVRLDLLARTYR